MSVVQLCRTVCDPMDSLFVEFHQAPCPWNSPGKSTGVGSHSLFQGIFLTQGSNPGLLRCRLILYHLSYQGSPQNIRCDLSMESHQAPCPWNSPGKSTGVGSHSLLQGIFLTQGSNPGLLHCRLILYHLSYQGSPQKIRSETQRGQIEY